MKTTSVMVPLVALAFGACDSLLEVDNPNNVVQEDLETPTAAAALVNGTLSMTADGMAEILNAHAGISDEFIWRGSFTNMELLDRGYLQDDANAYTADAFNSIAAARWMGDETIGQLEAFAAAGTLEDPVLLDRAYLYSGIVYSTIPDMFENFAFSDRTEAGPPVGPENMHTMYDMAVERLDAAAGSSDAGIRLAALAMRARARWAQELWHKLDSGDPAADPLVSSAEADADAAAALALAPADWRFDLTFGPTSQQNAAASDANSRLEIAVAPEYAQQDASEKLICAPFNPKCPTDGILIMDPIDDVQDPALRDLMWEFIQAFVYSPLIVVSARELHLILAESALAQDDIPTFTTEINAVRALSEIPGGGALTPYDPAVHTGITPADLLLHERRVNLFNMIQRRLADLYRFGVTSPQWASASEASTAPGTVFKISVAERVANCHLNNECGG